MDLIRDVRLEIDELVFTGLGALDAAAVAAVFEHELTRLVRSHGLPADALRPERVADAIAALSPLPATGSARRFGNALASALFAGLSGGETSQMPATLSRPAQPRPTQRPPAPPPESQRSAA